MIFDHCGRFDWRSAQQVIDQTRTKLDGRTLAGNTGRTLLYLEAMCKQAQGDLQGALDVYQASNLVFEPDVKYDNAEKDFRALAALNSIMILRTLGIEDVEKASNLHAAIEPHCLNHQNKSFGAAFFMTKATSNDSKVAIIKTKQYLQSVKVPVKSTPPTGQYVTDTCSLPGCLRRKECG